MNERDKLQAMLNKDPGKLPAQWTYGVWHLGGDRYVAYRQYTDGGVITRIELAKTIDEGGTAWQAQASWSANVLRQDVRGIWAGEGIGEI